MESALRGVKDKERRIHFLNECLEEQVVPISAPKHLKEGDIPFKSSAREWIREGIEKLKNDLELDKHQMKTCHLEGERLPERIHRKLREEDTRDRQKKRRRLEARMNDSKWRTVGREDIVTNLSDKVLTGTEKEVLSLGPKFDTGIPRKGLGDLFIANHRWKDSGVDQGMAQGLVLAAYLSSQAKAPALPRRYREAINTLRQDGSITVTTADKGGGFVVMNKGDYIAKMHDLLDDPVTYKRVENGNAARKAKSFTTEIRAILRDCEEGKRLLRHLPQNPQTPSMRGLPKVHKPGVPMRPITNGRDSAPHALASELAKPLTQTLGSISGTHLKNTSDLINRLKGKGLRNKKLVGLDVVSLFTKVPVDEALAAARRSLERNPDLALPVPRDTFMRLVETCVRFGAFEFESQEFEQIDGLPMGSPLSGVLANLFMESLEADHYLGIVGQHAWWVRYADDVTTLISARIVTEDLVARLNAVHPRIQFTFEEERDNQLPVLDVLIRRSENHEPRFSVYRKPTHKDDYIHFLSAHSDRVKSGVVIGLFLRALRICSPEYLEDEFKTIIAAFKRLHYPEGMLLRLKGKAIAIRNTGQQDRKKDTRPLLIVPHSSLTEQLEQHLGKHLRIATPAQTRIGEMAKTARKKHSPEDSVIYKIPCGEDSCPKAYYGQTSRGLQKRLKEHMAAFKNGHQQSPFIQHAWNTNHLPRWTDAAIIHKGIPSKAKRLFLESALIRSNPNLNSDLRQRGDYQLSLLAATYVSASPS